MGMGYEDLERALVRQGAENGRLQAEIGRLRAAADPERITRAVLAVMAKGGDNLAIFNAVKAACEQTGDEVKR